MNGKNKDKGLFRVSVYFNEKDLATIIKESEKSGFRRVGIPVKIQKPHGMANEWLANTDGASKMLKKAFAYYVEHEADRIKALAEAMAQAKATQDKVKALGGTV